jgi:RNA polymerase sigma factor (sigma-70 family)
MTQQNPGRDAGGLVAVHRTRDAADAELQRFLDSCGGRLLLYVESLLPADVRKLHDPLDVLQDVFLEAFCLACDCPLPDHAAALRWLKTIARRNIADLGRHYLSLKRRGRGGPGDGVPRYGSVVALLEELVLYTRTPSKSAAAHEFFRVFEDALDRLPREYAEVVRLRHLEHLSEKQAAQRMGRSVKSTERLLSRALEMLRLGMAAFDEGPSEVENAPQA